MALTALVFMDTASSHLEVQALAVDHEASGGSGLGTFFTGKR